MKKGVLVLGMALVVLAGVVEAQLGAPPAGEDFFPATEAELGIVFVGPLTTQQAESQGTIGCSGPTTIMRGESAAGMIPTEIVSMSLSCSGGIMVHGKGRGEINTQTGDSFFDVFVDIQLPDRTMLSGGPARVQSTIGHIPPLGSIYFGVHPVDLVSGGQVVAQLTHIKHKTNGVPKPESTGEVSPVFSCFYECKRRQVLSAGQPIQTWQEVTTLMLVNQSHQNLIAEIFFINGNQRPIARTKTSLSPEDLDEINVCETLAQATPAVPVPPAGLIEVVLSGPTGVPQGGAYGWVKNVSGTFRRDLPEPFDPFNTVTGIAKTECRLVGPNVVTPRQIQAKMDRLQPPSVNPILIEGTGGPNNTDDLPGQ